MRPARRLVVDLAATAPSWALPSWGEAAILSAAPEDWEVRFIRDLTVSDGDGTGEAHQLRRCDGRHHRRAPCSTCAGGPS